MLTHYSTNGALYSLTLEIGRDPVFSVGYGRSWNNVDKIKNKYPSTILLFTIKSILPWFRNRRTSCLARAAWNVRKVQHQKIQWTGQAYNVWDFHIRWFNSSQDAVNCHFSPTMFQNCTNQLPTRNNMSHALRHCPFKIITVLLLVRNLDLQLILSTHNLQKSKDKKYHPTSDIKWKRESGKLRLSL